MKDYFLQRAAMHAEQSLMTAACIVPALMVALFAAVLLAEYGHFLQRFFLARYRKKHESETENHHDPE